MAEPRVARRARRREGRWKGRDTYNNHRGGSAPGARRTDKGRNGEECRVAVGAHWEPRGGRWVGQGASAGTPRAAPWRTKSHGRRAAGSTKISLAPGRPSSNRTASPGAYPHDRTPGTRAT